MSGQHQDLFSFLSVSFSLLFLVQEAEVSLWNWVWWFVSSACVQSWQHLRVRNLYQEVPTCANNTLFGLFTLLVCWEQDHSANLISHISPCRVGEPELPVHLAARKHGLTLHVELSYFELPLCTDRDTGKVEMISWPFILPSSMVARSTELGKCVWWWWWWW